MTSQIAASTDTAFLVLLMVWIAGGVIVLNILEHRRHDRR